MLETVQFTNHWQGFPGPVKAATDQGRARGTHVTEFPVTEDRSGSQHGETPPITFCAKDAELPPQKHSFC